MLLIGCAKAKLLAEKIDGITSHDVKFEVKRIEGLSLLLDHTAVDDKSAKVILKEIIKTIPELKGFYVNVQMVDQTGKIL